MTDRPATSQRLFLREHAARREYECHGCGRAIPKKVLYFRHDPHAFDAAFRGRRASQWCHPCIDGSPAVFDPSTGRFRLRVVDVLPSQQFPQAVNPDGQRRLYFEPVRVELLAVGAQLVRHLLEDPEVIYKISPDQFEELICDRLTAMGLDVTRVGSINRKDGGIDIFFWPKPSSAFPFLGAAQVKHHRNPKDSVGPAPVRDLAGAASRQHLAAALLVTNTGFTPDANWFAASQRSLIRLRDHSAVQRWLQGQFKDSSEWREIPETIEVCPGIVVPVGPSRHQR